MKKILFIVQLPPPVHGASLINSYIVNNPLLKEKFSVKVLPLQFASAIADIGKFSLKKLLLIPGFAVNLVWTLFIFRPALVYYNLAPAGLAFYRDALYALMIKASGCKLALHIQGQGVEENSGKRKWKKWLYKQVFRNSFPICLAERLYTDIESVHRGKYYILNCAIPVQDDLPPKQINKYPVFIFLSNLYKSKGILTFLDSMKILKQRGMHFKAMVVGNTGDFTIDAANAYVNANNLADNIKVIGPLYGEEKFEALCAADYFIFPTVKEAFPLTILEAMQCGLVTVSTFTGAIPDMITDGLNGKLCNSTDPQAWATLLENLVNDPESAKQMRETARSEFHEKYTLEIFDRNVFTIIQDILNKQ
ncbi:glycosyltransferase family 4 protein [Agriterribacter sp.]|uniref:glycosyltransferase family 4 protein n=1 Tax=Agriterribacter sp. TaxID=2821509 RepID=UPI002BEA08EA|nr:glycosyltransferase family 4 protein [Agriterribacter sp.]HTN08895.1 glycosyltransferase family 4 protein [Agriterribacter sp.]